MGAQMMRAAWMVGDATVADDELNSTRLPGFLPCGSWMAWWAPHTQCTHFQNRWTPITKETSKPRRTSNSRQHHGPPRQEREAGAGALLLRV